MQLDAMQHGRSLYISDSDSIVYINVLQMKGPYIMHKFRTSKRVHLEVDPQILNANITFDGDDLLREFQINMHLEPLPQVVVDQENF